MQVEAGTTYLVRQPTAHPVHENWRVRSFRQLLRATADATGGSGDDSEQLAMLGELMYQVCPSKLPISLSLIPAFWVPGLPSHSHTCAIRTVPCTFAPCGLCAEVSAHRQGVRGCAEPRQLQPLRSGERRHRPHRGAGQSRGRGSRRARRAPGTAWRQNHRWRLWRYASLTSHLDSCSSAVIACP